MAAAAGCLQPAALLGPLLLCGAALLPATALARVPSCRALAAASPSGTAPQGRLASRHAPPAPPQSGAEAPARRRCRCMRRRRPGCRAGTRARAPPRPRGTARPRPGAPAAACSGWQHRQCMRAFSDSIATACCRRCSVTAATQRGHGCSIRGCIIQATCAQHYCLPTYPTTTRHLWVLAQAQHLAEVGDGLLPQDLRVADVAPHHLGEGVPMPARLQLRLNQLRAPHNLAAHGVVGAQHAWVDGRRRQRRRAQPDAVDCGSRRRRWCRHGGAGAWAEWLCCCVSFNLRPA